MLHYRVHGFLLMELTVWKTFQSHVFQLSIGRWDSSNENTEHFANIWKAALASFDPSNYAFDDYTINQRSEIVGLKTEHMLLPKRYYLLQKSKLLRK